jgi:hypothetical protein
MEFVLPVLDYGEGRRWHGTYGAHDEPLSIRRHIELKVSGGVVLRGARDSEESLRLAEFNWPCGWHCKE